MKFFLSFTVFLTLLAHAAHAQSASSLIAPCEAEAYVQPGSAGLWEKPPLPKTFEVRGVWLDFSIHGAPYHKQLVVRLQVERENGVTEHFLHRPVFKGYFPGGREKWGSDFELFPYDGFHGKISSVKFSYLINLDLDEDGRMESCLSKHQYSLADSGHLAAEAGVLPDPVRVGMNPVIYPSTARSPRQPAHNEIPGTPDVDVVFAPWESPWMRVVQEAEKVIAAKRSDRNGYHYIHASIYNINDSRIVDKLLEAHAEGVDVRISTGINQLTPEKTWNQEYARMQRAGIEVIGVARSGFAASNHTKIAVFNGKVVTAGSFNWERVSSDANSENMLILNSESVAVSYQAILHAVSGLPYIPPFSDSPAHPWSLWYSQGNNVPSLLAAEINSARKSIVMSMFTLRRMQYEENGQWKELLDSLVQAVRRGVRVVVVLEKNIADEGEYYGRITPDDPTDEWLSDMGVEIVKVRRTTPGYQYSSMHHKFVVIDDATVLTGAYNWFSGSQVSDDDVIRIRDEKLALRYLGEVNQIRMHNDSGFDSSSVRQSPVTVRKWNADTRPGDRVFITGDIPQLGRWNVSDAVELSAKEWPKWQADVRVPAGVYFNYKFFVRHSDGRISWEQGNNRRAMANPFGLTQTLEN